MIDERIGIIGSTQGVSDSRRPTANAMGSSTPKRRAFSAADRPKSSSSSAASASVAAVDASGVAASGADDVAEDDVDEGAEEVADAPRPRIALRVETEALEFIAAVDEPVAAPASVGPAIETRLSAAPRPRSATWTVRTCGG